MGDKGEGELKKSQKMGDIIYGWPQGCHVYSMHVSRKSFICQYNFVKTSWN